MEQGERPELPRGVVLGLAFASLGMLTLQVSVTRVFSLLVWYHFAFLAIALALLGFTAGGLVVQLRPRLGGEGAPRRLARLSIAAAVATVIALLVATQLPFGTSVVEDAKQLGVFALLLVAVLAPFVLVGVVVATTLAAFRRSVPRLYFADLLGSGIGCALSLAALDRLGGGAGGVLVAALSFALAGVAFGSRDRRFLVKTAAVAPAIAALVLLARDPLRDPFYLPNAKLYPRVPRELVLSRRCTSLACVDFFQNPAHFGLWGLSTRYKGPLPDQIGVVIDAWAITSVLKAERGPDGAPSMSHPALEALPPAFPYQFLRATGRKAPDVMVIGAGGGLDVRTALHFKAKHVDAVDINRTIVDAVGSDFDAWSGGLYHRPDVNVAVSEGRHALRRANKRWDLVQISGVDTYAASQAGAFALTENYLYTVEAFREYLGHLTDDGTLALTRWLYDPPRQTLRLCAIADRAMRELGLGDAASRTVVIGAPVLDSTIDFSVVLVRRTPFTTQELAAIRKLADILAFRVVWSPDGLSPDNAFARYFRAADKAAFVRAYPYRIDPNTDDQPFFFEHNRFSRLLESRDAIFGGASGQLVLVVTLGIVLLLGVALVAIPARVAKAVSLPGRWQVYFVALGLGYIAVELALVPKFVLYLGHPSHALSIVLFSMLCSSGVGAALSPRIVRGRRSLARVAIAIAIVLAIVQLATPKVFDATLSWSLPARAAIAVALVAVPATLMGMPFPSALAFLGRGEEGSSLVAHAWVLNGGASVVASVLAMIVAMAFGFAAVLFSAAGCYVVAAVVALSAARGTTNAATR